MLPSMFGMGGSEILVILIVALLFLGPEKLPGAAKQISKGIRDLKKQSRALQNQIESDEQIGGAIRDLKSALRGEEPVVRAKPIKKLPKELLAAATISPAADALDGLTAAATPAEPPEPSLIASDANAAVETTSTKPAAEPDELAVAAPSAGVRLPPTAGEADPDVPENPDDDAELASMIRPAAGTVAKGSEPGPEHG